MTRQKRTILEELRKVKSHPTADELFQIVRKKLPRVSLGTIYRNLEILTSEKKVRVLEDGNAPRRYDGDIGRHFHVRCVQCGAVSDLVNPVELPIMDTFIDESGYRVTGFHLEFQGICPDCLRSASGKAIDL